MNEKTLLKKLSIPGKPKAKGRPYVTGHHTFTPKDTVLYENYIKTLWMNSHEPCSNYTGPLALRVVAYMDIPKSASKKKRTEMELGNIKPTTRPDLDNIIKVVKDALNGIAWHDDSQVVELTGYKAYSTAPRVDVWVFYLGVQV